MANSNFVVKNGLQVGDLTIFAANGGIATSGAISTTGGFDGVDATAITNGTSKVQVFENTTIGFNVGGSANVMTIASGGDVTISGDLTVNGSTTTINTTTLDVEDKNITIASGAADSSAADGAGLTVDGASATFNYTHSGTKWVANKDIEATGLITPDITKTGTNGVGDIGQSGNKFGTIYGLASSAQYADLAEKYEADAEVEPGTVVHFGGEKEVSMCDVDHCQAVAGVVSTAPAFRMNDDLEAEHVAMVALQGRVPCKVTGPVHKGDMMVSAGNGMARAEANPKVGAVIGKALENWEGGEGVIEVVVGKH